MQHAKSLRWEPPRTLFFLDLFVNLSTFGLSSNWFPTSTKCIFLISRLSVRAIPYWNKRHYVCMYVCMCLSVCLSVYLSIYLFIYLLSFLGLHPGVWKFPGQGSNWSCSCWPVPQPQQHQIRAASAAYATAHGNARSLTHWARPGIVPASSWMLVGFVNHWATTGTPRRHHLLKRVDHVSDIGAVKKIQRNTVFLPLSKLLKNILIY